MGEWFGFFLFVGVIYAIVYACVQAEEQKKDEERKAEERKAIETLKKEKTPLREMLLKGNDDLVILEDLDDSEDLDDLGILGTVCNSDVSGKKDFGDFFRRVTTAGERKEREEKLQESEPQAKTDAFEEELKELKEAILSGESVDGVQLVGNLGEELREELLKRGYREDEVERLVELFASNAMPILEKYHKV